MDKTARTSEARLAIAAANPNMPFAEVDQKARAFVADEEFLEREAEFLREEAAAAEAREAERERRRAGTPSDGPSLEEMYAQLKDMDMRDAGW